MREVSRVGVWDDLSGGSILGLIREVMLMCVRVWRVLVRLITIRSARNSCHILANSFPSEFVERFSKRANNFYVTSGRIVAQFKDQSESDVGVPRNTKAIEAPKASLDSIRMSFVHSPPSPW
jgi:hypothetical protein